MKQKLLELHQLPRQVLEAEIQRIDCTKNGQFNMADQGCWGCEVGAECVSMLRVALKDKASLAELSVTQLKNSLMIARRFIDDIIQSESSPAGVCNSELSKWSQQVDFVLSASAPEEIKARVAECLH